MPERGWAHGKSPSPYACVSKCGKLKVVSRELNRFSAIMLARSRWPMLIVHVHVRVKEDAIEAFKAATLENARQSLQEPGVVRFDVVQQLDDPSRFVLVEVYRDESAPGAHKQTAHYQRWRDEVEPWMAEPRRSVKFSNVFPHDSEW
jgi:autoinducer 2-degrading protein